MKTTIVALCLMQIFGMQMAFAGSSAKEEFKALSQQKLKQDYNNKILSAIRAQGCDTKILASEAEEDENAYAEILYISTVKCSCLVHGSTAGFARPGYRSEADAIYINSASANCVKK